MTIQELASETGLSDLPDRIVVSPGHGRLRLEPAHVFTSEGEVVRAGDVLARIESGATTLEVTSPCDAWVLGVIAADGERVRPGSPLLHLREL